MTLQDNVAIKYLVCDEIRRMLSQGELNVYLDAYVRNNIGIRVEKHGDTDYMFSLCLNGRPFYNYMVCFQEEEELDF